jgi:sulfite reductase (NADPH) hemoprotein beta-component
VGLHSAVDLVKRLAKRGGHHGLAAEVFGGRADEKAAIGTIQGPGLRHEEVAPAIRRVIGKYLELRTAKSEKFIDTMMRVGQAPFKDALYASA